MLQKAIKFFKDLQSRTPVVQVGAGNIPFGHQEISREEARTIQEAGGRLVGLGDFKDIQGALGGTATSGIVDAPELGLTHAKVSDVEDIRSKFEDPNLINVGTKTAPKFIPKGSPGAKLSQSPDFNAATTGRQDMPQNLHIGPTNFANLQKQFTPAQIEAATIRRDGDIFWNPNVNIESLDAQGKKKKLDGISVDQLAPAQKTQVPTTTIDTGSTASVVASANQSSKTINDYIAQLTTETTETEQQYDDILSKYTDLLEDTAGRGQEQLAQEQKFQVDKLRTDLSNINSQIQTKAAEYESLITEQEGKPITMNSIIGAQAQIRKAMASEIGLLQARALGLQGQLGAAQSNADRAVDLKYTQVEDNLKIYEAQLNALMPELSKEERIRAQAQQNMIADQRQAIADQKEEEKQIQKIMLDAISSGVDSSIVDQIGMAENFEEAAGLLSKNMASELVSGPTDISVGDELVDVDGLEAVIDEEINSYVSLVRDGRLTEKQALDEVSKDKKTQLISALASTPTRADTQADIMAKDKAKSSLDLQAHPGLNSSVGPIKGTRGTITFDRLTGQRQDFIAGVEQLLSGLSLESLIDAKSRGATFGALSNREMNILSSAATKIGTWRREDKRGNVTHYNVSEKKFKEELDSISKVFKRITERKVGAGESADETIDPMGILGD
jgi:hypothetical protein